MPYYPNGQRVVDGFGEEYDPNGARYPNGGRTRDPGGRCYFETGIEMTPCQRVVAIRDRLPGGETAFDQLDIVAGTLDLRQVRYEDPAPGHLIAVAVDLVAGRLDRGSIAAICPSGRPSR